MPSLRKAGFDATLVASGTDAEMPEDIPSVALPSTEGRLRRFPLLWQAWRRARSLRADVYQIHDPELLPVGLLLKRTTGAPLIYDMHEDYRAKGAVLGRTLRALERWGGRQVDHVLFAEGSYQSILDGWDVDHTLIANYFKPVGQVASGRAAEEQERASRRPTRLLYTGTVAQKRGLGTMLDLASAIWERGRDETVTVVGICRHPKQRAAADTRVQDEGLEAVLARVGWDVYVPPATMPPYYRQADVGLALCEPHPNLVGSLLTKFYEYLHYGLPIICSDFPLWRRFIEENECGAVVPPGDAEAVLDVLTRWRQRPDVYRAYVRNARAAADQYRWEEMGQRLVQVYRDLLNSDGA